jgi:pimeloyl-ACP methyl ester carboxylesterase
MAESADLSLHIADVVNLIRFENLENIVLVGHSYGGMVISGAVEHLEDKVRTLVFLDALVPCDGESTLELLGVAPGDPPRPSPTAAAFNVSAAHHTAVDAHLTRQPAPALAERIRLTGARERVRRRVFVMAPDWPGYDAIIEPIAGRLAKDPSWTMRQIDCGHLMMIDKPDETASLLLAATE